MGKFTWPEILPVGCGDVNYLFLSMFCLRFIKSCAKSVGQFNRDVRSVQTNDLYLNCGRNGISSTSSTI